MNCVEWARTIRRMHADSGLSIREAARRSGICSPTYRQILIGKIGYKSLSGRIRQALRGYFGLPAPDDGEEDEAPCRDRDGFTCRIGHEHYTQACDLQLMDELSTAIAREGLADEWIDLDEERARWWRKRQKYAIIATWLDQSGQVDVSMAGRVEVREGGMRWIAD